MRKIPHKDQMKAVQVIRKFFEAYIGETNPGFDSNLHPVTGLIDEFEEIIKANDSDLEEMEALMRMWFLKQQIENLTANNDIVHLQFQESFLNLKDVWNFYGWRFELNIASSLTTKNIEFDKIERPDFIITSDEFSPSKIECTSSKLDNYTDIKDLSYKIGSAMNKKGNKDYSDSSTALFIDITNLIGNRENMDEKIGFTEYRELLIKLVGDIEDYKFGSTLLFAYTLSTERLSSNYWREDSEVVDQSLKSLLDHAYPKGDVRVDFATTLENG